VSVLWLNQRPTFGSRLASFVLRAAGWESVIAPPPGPKFVAAAAPHTSNLDFWPALLWRWATRIPVHWVGKKELFQFPLGLFMRAVGGLPVNRQKAGGNFVDAVVALIHSQKEIVLVVAPEGTRKRGQYWKTGFYHMALEAGVPIGIVVLDWQHKRVGIIGYLNPTGDIHADFAVIREMLKDVRGRVPAFETPIIPRPKEEAKASKA
jgi:1-acyl-sn-glycerol-3-phosphate acyltransferase